LSWTPDRDAKGSLCCNSGSLCSMLEGTSSLSDDRNLPRLMNLKIRGNLHSMPKGL
jgi:hypothetical protein